MGYFDYLDATVEKTHEVGGTEKKGVIAFWYSIGSLGMLLHSVILLFVLGWGNSVFAGIPLLFAIALGLVGLVYSIVASRAAKTIRQKIPVAGMARAYCILWLLLAIIMLCINSIISIQAMIG